MKLLLLLIAVVAVTAGSSCSVGEWGSWGGWRRASHDDTVTSYPQHAKTGKGQEARRKLMKMKTERVEYRRTCLADGSCPELASKPSEGPAPCLNGFINGNIPCANIDQQSFVDFVNLGADYSIDPTPECNDIWGWYDAVTGDEYAIVGIESGTSFVRITDPQVPVTVGWLPSQTGVASTWRDMKVIGDFAYIVSEADDHGIQFYDLTKLRGRNSIVTDSADLVYTEVGNCHNIVANEQTNYIYGVGCDEGPYPNNCNGGLHVVDVTDPLNPVFAGCFDGDGYVHDAQCVNYVGPDPEHQGKEICFCYNEDTFTIVDVTDKTNMQMLSKSGYTISQYTHQGWVTEDHTVALLDDELDEYNSVSPTTTTLLWDIRDLDAPVLMNTYVAPHTSIDHNQYIIGDITYQANYESGLRILRIDQENYMLSEIAHFDVLPSSTTPQFFGSWSVYPYLPSRNVIISSIDYGLYVVRPDYDVIDFPISVRGAMKERHRYRKVLVADDLTTCPNLEQVQRD